MGQVRPRAAVISTVGALGVAASAYFDWGSDASGGAAEGVPLQRLLFASDVPSNPEYWQSMAAPLVVVGGIGVLGALLLSRVVLLISFLLGLTTAGLWVATEVQESSGFSIDSVRLGGWVVLAALIVLLVGLIALRRRQDDEEEDDIMPFSPTPRSHSSFLPDDEDEGTSRIGPRPGPSTGPGTGEPSPFAPNDQPTSPQVSPPPGPPRDQRPADPF